MKTTLLILFFMAGLPGLVSCSAPTNANSLGPVFLADTGHNRILIYNSAPSSATDQPDLVLGQPDFPGTTANSGGLSAASLNGPASVFYDGRHLLVSDTGNNRVLIWNS